jgi:(2Fe-2S) ferredoxin
MSMAKRYAHHVVLCNDTAREGCASASRMRKAWKRLGQAVAGAGLDKQVLCTRSRCLDVCKAGPIAIVYPEGVWYRHFEGKAIDRVIEQLEKGRSATQRRLPLKTGGSLK